LKNGRHFSDPLGAYLAHDKNTVMLSACKIIVARNLFLVILSVSHWQAMMSALALLADIPNTDHIIMTDVANMLWETTILRTSILVTEIMG